MSEHLPECKRADIHDPQGLYCICAELRACEERCDKAWERLVREEKAKSYATGVAAARGAVEGMNPCWQNNCRFDALAAIDALQGES